MKTRKYGINPLFDCFHASYLPILMEIGTEVLILKIALIWLSINDSVFFITTSDIYTHFKSRFIGCLSDKHEHECRHRDRENQ